MIALLLFLIAAPIYLIIAAFMIGATFLLELLPTLVTLYVVLAVLVLLFTPFKPWYQRHTEKIHSIAAWVALILFGPLVAVILFALIALPFALIFAISDNPFIWSGLVVCTVVTFCIISYRAYEREKEEKIWQATRERAAMHKYLYSERK